MTNIKYLEDAEQVLAALLRRGYTFVAPDKSDAIENVLAEVLERIDLPKVDNTSVQQALQLFDTDPQLGYQNAAKVLREHINALTEELKWAWEDGAMQFVAPDPDPESEYDFCRSCGKPEWKHKPNCSALEHKARAKQLLNGGTL